MLNESICLRPATPSDTQALWQLIDQAGDELTGMSSLPSGMAETEKVCVNTSATIASLAADSFRLDQNASARIVFIITRTEDPTSVLGVSGLTVKVNYPNLAVTVTTSGDGQGLTMRSLSQPWTRTELDSSYLAPAARSKGLGTLLSRGRFLFLQLVKSQLPDTVASHLRGPFSADGSAPFWKCFGAHFAPQWTDSIQAEEGLRQRPELLDSLADHLFPVSAKVLGSLGVVNSASLPAFHLLSAEGMGPNGMYDPIDGGPTLCADLVDLVSTKQRIYGPTEIDPDADSVGIDGLASTSSIEHFRALRCRVRSLSDKVLINPAAAKALEAETGDLLTAVPVSGETLGAALS